MGYAFYATTLAVIIVFSKSEQESLGKIPDLIEETRNLIGRESFFFLVGNKSDLEPAVSTDEGQELALRFGMHYIETSAKNDYQINELFEIIIRLLIEKGRDQKVKI